MPSITHGEAAIALLKHFEQGPNGGFAPVAYLDWAGHPTIGWGHRILGGERFQQPITEPEADALLRKDLTRFAESLSRAVRVPLTPSMADALLCFAYNVGAGALLGSTLLAALNRGAYAMAADEFLRWDKATNPKTGKKEALAGLTRRRKAERDLFLREGLPR